MHAFRPFPCEPRTGCSAGWDTADNQSCLVSCEPWESGTYITTPRKSVKNLHMVGIYSLSQHTVVQRYWTLALDLNGSNSSSDKRLKKKEKQKWKCVKRPVFTAVTYSICPEVQPCTEDSKAHLLHMWLHCCAPAECRTGEQREGVGGCTNVIVTCAAWDEKQCVGWVIVMHGIIHCRHEGWILSF